MDNNIWGLLGCLMSGLQLFALIVLARERIASVWLMISGTAIGLVITLAILTKMVPLNQNTTAFVTAGSWFGYASFVLGLLWFALKRSAMASRIEELEAVLRAHSHQQTDARASSPVDPC
jgi:hypothetical protein